MSEVGETYSGLLEWELVVVAFSSSYTSLEEATAAVQLELGSVFKNGENFDFCQDRIRELCLMGMSLVKRQMVAKGDAALLVPVKERTPEQLGDIATRANILKKVNEIVRRIRDALFPKFMTDAQVIAFAARYDINIKTFLFAYMMKLFKPTLSYSL